MADSTKKNAYSLKEMARGNGQFKIATFSRLSGSNLYGIEKQTSFHLIFTLNYNYENIFRNFGLGNCFQSKYNLNFSCFHVILAENSFYHYSQKLDQCEQFVQKERSKESWQLAIPGWRDCIITSVVEYHFGIYKIRYTRSSHNAIFGTWKKSH